MSDQITLPDESKTLGTFGNEVTQMFGHKLVGTLGTLLAGAGGASLTPDQATNIATGVVGGLLVVISYVWGYIQVQNSKAHTKAAVAVALATPVPPTVSALPTAATK